MLQLQFLYSQIPPWGTTNVRIETKTNAPANYNFGKRGTREVKLKFALLSTRVPIEPFSLKMDCSFAMTQYSYSIITLVFLLFPLGHLMYQTCRHILHGQLWHQHWSSKVVIQCSYKGEKLLSKVITISLFLTCTFKQASRSKSTLILFVWSNKSL